MVSEEVILGTGWNTKLNMSRLGTDCLLASSHYRMLRAPCFWLDSQGSVGLTKSTLKENFH